MQMKRTRCFINLGKLLQSAAVAAVAASVVRFARYAILLSLGFLRMPQLSARTIERFRLFERDIDNRVDKLEELAIWRLFVEIVGLIANCITLAALHVMIVVIEHFLERPAINHRLITLETCALLSLKSFDRYRAKPAPLTRAPRTDVTSENLYSVNPRRFKCGEKTFFSERAGNAAAPKLRIGLHFFGDWFVTDDVANDRASTLFEDPENLVKQLLFRFWLYKIEDAIGNDNVD